MFFCLFFQNWYLKYLSISFSQYHFKSKCYLLILVLQTVICYNIDVSETLFLPVVGADLLVTNWSFSVKQLF